MANPTIDLWPANFGRSELEYPDDVLEQQAALLVVDLTKEEIILWIE